MAELVVTIKKGDGTIPNQAQESKQLSMQESNVSKSQINTLMIDYGKKLMQQGFNTYINITGETLMGNRVNELVNVSGDILTIIKGGYIGLAAVGFKHATKILDTYIQNNKANNNAEFLKSSMGKVRTNGGRYV